MGKLQNCDVAGCVVDSTLIIYYLDSAALESHVESVKKSIEKIMNVGNVSKCDTFKTLCGRHTRALMTPPWTCIKCRDLPISRYKGSVVRQGCGFETFVQNEQKISYC